MGRFEGSFPIVARKEEWGQDLSGQYVTSQRKTAGDVQVDICDWWTSFVWTLAFRVRWCCLWRTRPFCSWRTLVNLFIFCWPCISLQILANNQLVALFHVFIYFTSLHVSSITVLIIRGSNYINISSGMISLCKWLFGMPVWHTKQSLTQTNHTRWCNNIIRSPDDEHCDARNM